uniref:Uncharacterized protein n=1 Tax=Bionectria ochroleuca TaxID=29856 RepID=A0A8H7KEH4_BIOOC
MHFTSSLLALLAASAVEAQQFLINELSFGHSGRLSPPDANGQIPGFSIASSGRPLQILSNKVILTPVSPETNEARYGPPARLTTINGWPMWTSVPTDPNVVAAT